MYYVKVSVQYKLTGEEGPPHDKTFTTTLTLGEESYTAKGRSIKQSQHSAAEMALKATNHQKPPAKARLPYRRCKLSRIPSNS